MRKLMKLSAEHEKRGSPGLKPARGGRAWIDDWLTTHVAGSDMALARHLKAQGLPVRADPGPTAP